MPQFSFLIWLEDMASIFRIKCFGRAIAKTAATARPRELISHYRCQHFDDFGARAADADVSMVDCRDFDQRMVGVMISIRRYLHDARRSKYTARCHRLAVTTGHFILLISGNFDASFTYRRRRS
jgi:hypothetical protein